MSDSPYASISSGTLIGDVIALGSTDFELLCELEDENCGTEFEDGDDSDCNQSGFSPVLNWFAVRGTFDSYDLLSESFGSANGFSSS